jgi:hypothetical protein
MPAMANPVRMTMPEMVARSLLLRLRSMRLFLEVGQVPLHGPDGLIPFFLQGQEAVNQELGQDLPAFRVPVHG